MNDVSFMHMFYPLTYLPHIVDDLCLTHGVALGSDPLKEFPSGQAGKEAVR